MLRFIRRPILLAILLVSIFAAACTPPSTPTIFRPPTQPQPTHILATTTPVPVLFTPVPATTITPTQTGLCVNDLEFLEDITIPDNTMVTIDSTIDKQWLIKNSGTCNWDSTYHLKWIGGDPMAARQDQVLFPARAGTQLTLRILFTAPAVEGTYESSWQAYGPDEIAFGDPVFMKIIVTP